jgi:hypothetical protein
MRTFQLSGGDLVLGERGYATITGTQKITQDIAMALGEPFGDDPYHTTWGSYLPGWRGEPIIPGSTPALVSAEVSRVLAGLIAAQQAQIASTAANSGRSAFTTADVIASVDSISATADADSVVVSMTISTQSGQQAQITRTVAS